MQATYQLLSGSTSVVPPFVVFGPLYGDEYTIEFKFDSPDELASFWPAVVQLNQSATTLLFQRPDGTDVWVTMGPGASGQDTKETYNAIAGDPTTVLWRRWKIVLTQTWDPPYY
jgi:hypothetical protein